MFLKSENIMFGQWASNMTIVEYFSPLPNATTFPDTSAVGRRKNRGSRPTPMTLTVVSGNALRSAAHVQCQGGW